MAKSLITGNPNHIHMVSLYRLVGPHGARKEVYQGRVEYPEYKFKDAHQRDKNVYEWDDGCTFYRGILIDRRNALRMLANR